MSLLKTGDINDTGVNVIGSMFDEGVAGAVLNLEKLHSNKRHDLSN